jgi:hypothetical protein
MNFDEALKKLGIEEYKERIFNSNSNGELFHCYDYIMLAEVIEDSIGFAEWFRAIVKIAEEKWSRPESVFQHIPEILENNIKELRNEQGSNL